MKKININDTFYDITKEDSNLKEALIDFGFKPMKEAAVYNTMGRVITLKKALNHIDKTESDLKAYLLELGIEVTFYE